MAFGFDALVMFKDVVSAVICISVLSLSLANERWRRVSSSMTLFHYPNCIIAEMPRLVEIAAMTDWSALSLVAKTEDWTAVQTEVQPEMIAEILEAPTSEITTGISETEAWTTEAQTDKGADRVLVLEILADQISAQTEISLSCRGIIEV